jgi:YVTN family beta-propeller protein
MPLYTQSPPYYMAAVLSLDGGTAYLLDVKGTVTVLSTQTNQVAARLTPGVPGSDTFQWIALSPDGTRYFITDSRLQKLLVLDARTNRVITTVDVGGVPRGVVISPDGSTAYIANQSGHVQYVDLQTYAITRTITVGGGGARGIVVTADGSTIYATEARGVAVISTVSNTVVRTIPVNGCCAVQLGLQLPPTPVRPAAQTPPAAAQVLEEAKAKAAAGQKSIFLIFHASWCGWCKQLDKFIDTPENKAIIDRYFVVAHLTVQEQADKTALNHPGGEEILARVGGKNSGLPYFVFLDARGALIVNSTLPPDGKRGGSNIGHPVQPEEIDWFMAMLRKAVPALKEDEARALRDWLIGHAKS